MSTNCLEVKAVVGSNTAVLLAENKSLTEASELNYDWQINLVEGEKNIYKSNNKYENVEINFVFKVNIRLIRTKSQIIMKIKNKIINCWEWIIMNFRKF